MKFTKRFKEEDQVHGTYELFSELFVSRLGNVLGFPILEVSLTHEGLVMEYLPRKVTSPSNIRNLAQLKKALPFEEWVLNIDLKQDHLMADEEDNGYIIDHGHSLLSWKPLYYVYEIINKPVTRFNLWSDEYHFKEGVEIIRSLDKKSRDVLLKESVNEVLSYRKLDSSLVNDFLEVSSKILDYREKLLCSFKN